MKPLKKFSAILENDNSVLESLTKTYGTGIVDLVKKLGYNSMADIAKEKKLLSKLEALLKDLPKKADISEDDAEEIEADVLKRGEPKSIEGKAGQVVTKAEGSDQAEVAEADIEFDDEEEDEEVGAAGKAVPKEIGDGEKTSDEIEDDGLELGEPIAEPESKGETKVSPDEEITDDVPEEEDDPAAGRDVPIYPHEIGEEDEPQINDPEENDNPEGYPPPAGLSDDVPDPEEVDADEVEAARRIKTFEDFVAEDGDSSTSTVIKKVRYSDDATEPEDYGVPVAASADPMADVEEGYDGEKRGEDDEHKGDEDEDRGDKKVDSEDDEEKKKHYAGAVKSDDKEIAALKKDKDYDEEKEKAESVEEDHLILSFSKFVTEKYDKVVWGGDAGDKSKSDPGKVDYPEDEEDEKKEEKFDVVTLGGNKGDKSKTEPGEEDYEDDEKKDEDCKSEHEEEKDEAVTEETDEMEAKAETIEDEDKAEETGAAGITVPKIKGDGSESAAGIAAGTMEEGKPKKEPESLGAGFVTKEQPIEEEPETSPDEVGTKEGGKVVTSVPDSDVSENLTKKQQTLPEGLKRAILKKAGKTPAEIEEALGRMNEKEITSDDEFKEYATEVLKSAHGDDFDEAKADEVINGLKDKYKGDYGAMVGALQSSMG
jgi:hypothetical protein